MEPGVNQDDVRAMGDADQKLVRVEADRIALRRAFEDDLAAAIKGNTTIQ
jgi:hypothetical protein